MRFVAYFWLIGAKGWADILIDRDRDYFFVESMENCFFISVPRKDRNATSVFVRFHFPIETILFQFTIGKLGHGC